MAPLISEWEGYSLNLIAIYSKNSLEWVLTDTACALYNLVSCPMYDTLGEDAMAFILKETNITSCFLETNVIKNLLGLIEKGQNNKLKNVVVMDSLLLDKGLIKILDSMKRNFGINWFRFEDILKSGKANPKPYPKVLPEDVYTICYTSGTTGNPKGAILTHRNFAAVSDTTKFFDFIKDKEPLVH